MIRSAMPSFAVPSDRPMVWDDLTSRPRPKFDASIAYGSDAMQQVDVWLPAGEGPHPTVLMVHGGCWQSVIADRSLMDWAADDLRGAGFAVWNIDYRGVDRAGGGYPGTFEDAACAADLLALEGPRFGLDWRRVVAVGHSAGGHLASWLAGRPRLPVASPLAGREPLRIDRVVSLGGLPDLEATAATANGCGSDVVAQLVGNERADPYTDTSVARLLPIGVPQDLVLARKDRIVPHHLSLDYAAKAKAAGDAVTVHIIPDTGHVELVSPGTAAWDTVRRLVAAAFR